MQERTIINLKNKKTRLKYRQIRGLGCSVIETLLEILFERTSPLELWEMHDRGVLEEFIREKMSGNIKPVKQEKTKPEKKLNVDGESFWG